MKEAQEAYKNYSNAVNTAATVEEKQQAISDRNDYITSLLE
jgi:hypothetical protein